MADVTRANFSVASVGIPPTNKITGLVANEAITAGDACVITNVSGVAKIARAVGASGVVDGFAATTASVDEPVTLVHGVVVRYGSGLTPGDTVYLDGTVAGGLDNSATSNGPAVGRVIDSERIFVKRS